MNGCLLTSSVFRLKHVNRLILLAHLQGGRDDLGQAVESCQLLPWKDEHLGTTEMPNLGPRPSLVSKRNWQGAKQSRGVEKEGPWISTCMLLIEGRRSFASLCKSGMRQSRLHRPIETRQGSPKGLSSTGCHIAVLLPTCTRTVFMDSSYMVGYLHEKVLLARESNVSSIYCNVP